jgi:hypothetical protein
MTQLRPTPKSSPATVIAGHRASRDRRVGTTRRQPAATGSRGPSIELLLDRLGSPVLDVIAAPHGLALTVRAPVIYDASAPLTIRDGDLLLAVGVPPASAQGMTLLQQAARHGAVAVAFKASEDLDLLATSADRAGVAALVVPSGLAWDDLHGMLRTVIATAVESPTLGVGSPLGGEPLSDLFSLANAAAANLGGLVVLHDHRMQVVAFSTLDAPTDELATTSILRRMPPDWFLAWLESSGNLRRLLSDDDCLRLEPPDASPRLMRAVRADREILGWVSVIVADGASPDEAILAEAARVAALELVRLRGAEDVDRRLRTEILLGVLAGRSSVGLLAGRIGSAADRPAWLVALAPERRRPHDHPTATEVTCRRLADVCALRAEALERRSAVAVDGDTLYLLIPGSASRHSVQELVRHVVDHAASRLAVQVSGAFGEVARLDGLRIARADADRALRRQAEQGRVEVAAWDEFCASSVLEELADYAAQHQRLLRGPIATLAELDRNGRGGQLHTLRVFLDCSGDFTAASAQLHVHRNTLRYRIQRITEATGLDLSDPTERLVAELQLRLLERTGAAVFEPAERRAASA